MEDKMIDSSEYIDDDVLKNIDNIIKIKMDIFKLFKTDVIIDTMKKIINNSDIVKFNSVRSEKFINVKKPIFIVNVDIGKTNNDNNNDNKIDNLFRIVYDECIIPFNDFIISSIKSNDIDTTLFNNIPDIINKLKEYESLILSSIFGMRANKENNTVYIEYLF
jgi:hypothetical protein